MKIGQASRELGIPVPTLRRWTMEFTLGLSREAVGGNGVPRRFSAKDIRLLSQVKELLAEADSTYGGVREKLEREGFFQVTRVVKVHGGSSAQEPSTDEERIAVERYVMAIFERAMDRYMKQIEDLQQEVEDLREELEELREGGAVQGATAAKLPWPLRLVF